MIATTFRQTAVPLLPDRSTDRLTDPLTDCPEGRFPNSKITLYPTSLKRLIQTLKTSFLLSPAKIADIVSKAAVCSQDLMPWADFNHPHSDSYGRKLLFHGGHFEIMVMSWLPGDFSAIHDHGATEWGAVQCFGAADHTIYSFVDGTLKNPVAANYTAGMIRQVDHHLIHQMGNAGNQSFLSLHVYGCEQSVSSITGNARVFDLLEGAVQYTDGGVFFCLPEGKINKRDYGLIGDRETTILQYRLMCDRLRRMLADRHDISLAQKLTRLQTKLQFMC